MSDTEPVRLPDAARQRVLSYAGTALGVVDPAELPASLRRFAAFTPAKRGRLAGPALATALESVPAFRQAAAAVARATQPELAEAVEAGVVPAAADPAEVAALAYLTRPDGWEALVAGATAALADADAAARDDAERLEVERVRAEALAARASAKAELDRLRAEVAALKGEVATLRQAGRSAQDATRRAEAATAAADRELAAARAATTAAVANAEAQARRHRARVAELEAALEIARRSGREERGGDAVRLRLLLDAVVNAAAGLRRELALPPTSGRPGDLVAAALEGSGTAPDASGAPRARGLGPTDAAYLEALLAVPTAHVLVDGYNVTKTGYPTLSLEEQRTRLVTSLRALAARTGAEVTCVFDGASVPQVAGLGSRAVRVHFTPAGLTADAAIAAFVAAEPPGRPLVVVSTDREVADAATRLGAVAVPSTTLLAVIGR